MRGLGTSGSRQDGGIDEGRCLCQRQRGVEQRRRRPETMPVAGRSEQKSQGLEQTSSPAIGVSQRGGIFGDQGQPVGGEGYREGPIVRV